MLLLIVAKLHRMALGVTLSLRVRGLGGLRRGQVAAAEAGRALRVLLR